MQLVERMVLRSASKPLLLIFATIAAVRVPRSARFHIYTSVFPCSAALVRKRIATARLSPPARGFFLPHTLSSPNQLDRAARAWCVALKACPPSGEGTHGRLTRRVRGSSCAKKKRCALSRPGAEGEESDAPDQVKVEATPSACGAAGHELRSGAEPRACGLADGLGLGEGLVACARPARI